MKKLHLIILLLSVAMSCLAQTVGEAFYIYRNDGEFNAFFRDEVDSIAYSNYDTDSIYYDEAVMQVVYTQDSIYRIPLAAIDSVGFVQPTPIYEDNVRELSGNILDYIVSVDGMTVLMKANTPVDILPAIGDKLVQLGFTNLFPNGFVGKVSSVMNSGNVISINCDSITIGDAVKKFYAVYRASTDEVSMSRKGVNVFDNGEVQYKKQLKVNTIPLHVDLDDALWEEIWRSKNIEVGKKFSGKGDVSINITPYLIDIKVTYSKDVFIGLLEKYSIHTVTDFAAVEELQIVGELSKEKKMSLIPFPTDCQIVPTINFYWDAGIKLSGSGELGIGAKFSQSGRNVMDLNFYPIPTSPFVSIPITTLMDKIQIKEHKEDWNYAVGSYEFKLCGYLELGFSFLNHKISKAGGEIDFGLKSSGEIKFDIGDWNKADRSTRLYDECWESNKIALDVFLGVTGFLVPIALEERFKFEVGGDWDLPWFHGERRLFPSFNNVSFSEAANSLTEAIASTDVDGNCLFPLSLGFTLFDSKGEKKKTEYYKQNYWTPEISYEEFPITFSNLNIDEKYTVYPTISLFGKDIIASPSAELEMEFPVTFCGYEVTNSNYKKDGFIYDGITYKFKFDVTVRFILDDKKDVIDWGYVYVDEYGQEKEISLLQLSQGTWWITSDDRYAYYRNSPSASIRLYPYVKYANDIVIRGKLLQLYLEYKKLSCPDDNHPHMLDLGLPSGTKWACCNLGASAPENWGGYYAWGETKEKDTDYDPWTYQYSIKVNTCSGTYFVNEETGDAYIYSDIGSNICGTQYDAATAQWGNDWCMPTVEQFRELYEECISNVCEMHDIITSFEKIWFPNGYELILPEQGYRIGKDGFVVDTWSSLGAHPSGHYWTGELYMDRENLHSCPNIEVYWHSEAYEDRLPGSQTINRCYGLPIRPVAKKKK